MLSIRDTPGAVPPGSPLDEILSLVEDRRGLPLALYRRPMVERRIGNRIHGAREQDHAAYLARLRRDDRELDALVDAVCIKVSRFFRNGAVFEHLATWLRDEIAAGRRPRIWSAGCGRGEEAYSLAALLEAAGAPPELRVLTTDADPAALEATRAATYPVARLSEVPEAYRRWFDVPGDGTFRPGARLRARVVREKAELGSSPSATERSFDLLLCRNVLIYFSIQLRRRVEARLARALAPGGILCLGEAEWCSRPEELGLEPVDRRLGLLRASPEWPGCTGGSARPAC